LVFTEEVYLSYDANDWDIVESGGIGLDEIDSFVTESSGTNTLEFLVTGNECKTGEIGPGFETSILYSPVGAQHLLDGDDNALEQVSTPLIDNAPPVVCEASYLDTNADGTVDQVRLTFSENIYQPTWVWDAAEWTIEANDLHLTVDSFADLTDQYLTINVSADPGETGIANCDEQPLMSYNNTGNHVQDWQNNILENDEFQVDDAAPPVQVTGAYYDDDGDGTVDSIVATFTEAVSCTWNGGAGWGLADPTALNLSLTGLSVSGN